MIAFLPQSRVRLKRCWTLSPCWTRLWDANIEFDLIIRPGRPFSPHITSSPGRLGLPLTSRSRGILECGCELDVMLSSLSRILHYVSCVRKSLRGHRQGTTRYMSDMHWACFDGVLKAECRPRCLELFTLVLNVDLIRPNPLINWEVN